MRFPHSEANCEGRETTGEDNALRFSQARKILVAVNGEPEDCLCATILYSSTQDSHINYSPQVSSIDQVRFFANLLHKTRYIANETDKETLIQRGYQLVKNIDNQYSNEAILESIERKEDENNSASTSMRAQ